MNNLSTGRPAKKEAEAAVALLLSYIGADIQGDIKETPFRVIKSYEELFAGYGVKAEEILGQKFPLTDFNNNIVLLKSISFSSTCQHHLLPFFGTVDIAYIPDKEIIGISKIARLVNMFAKRLQLQEKMTAEISMALHYHLRPQGVAIRVKASHTCMTVRGVRQDNSIMETSYFIGIFKEAVYRTEFLTMIG